VLFVCQALNLATFLIAVEEFSPSWYSASPAIHQAILAQAKEKSRTTNRCPLRFIRSSSSPLPRKILGELESVFKAPVIESYGMTKASHQISSNPLPPATRKLGSVGIAAGPDGGVMDDGGKFIAVQGDGRDRYSR
jgi:acyl-CoA synthetase (AMP-forming)/AMP-acid ligase II